MKKLILSLSFILLTIFTTFSQAPQIPRLLNYQGELTDAGGNPIADGDQSITFKLYDVNSGGTELWSEVQTLPTVRGRFDAVLGSATPFPAAVKFDKNYWLGISINAGAEANPRTQILASAYSLRAAALSLPYSDSIETAFGGSALLLKNKDLTNNGYNVATFENLNPSNQGSPLTTFTNGDGPSIKAVSTGTGNAITASGTVQATKFVGDGSGLTNIAGGFTLPIDASGSTGEIFQLTHTGTDGSAADFFINNPLSNQATLFATTNGVGSAGSFGSSNAANPNSALFVTSNSTHASGPATLYAKATGLGTAGAFWSASASNTAAALYGNTAGTGIAVLGQTKTGFAATMGIMDSLGTGDAVIGRTNALVGSGGQFETMSGNNPDPTVYAFSKGLGNAGKFEITNSSSNADAISVSTAGTGNSLSAFNNGLGAAGSFSIGNSANSTSALVSTSMGIGSALAVGAYYSPSTAATVSITTMTSGNALNSDVFATGTGKAGSFTISNSGNTSTALYVATSGTGSAGYFNIGNAGSTADALFVKTDGTGNAIKAIGTIDATNFVGDGSGLTNLPGFSLPYGSSLNNGGTLFSITNTGTGVAADFRVSNSSSNANAIDAQSDGTGATISSTNSGTGRAGRFNITNSSNPNPAIEASTDGTGSAGNFLQNNSISSSDVLFVSNAGTGIAVHAQNVNPANTSSGIEVYHAGSGAAFYGSANGTGRGGVFYISNIGNASNAVEATTTGTGNAARFEIQNAGSTADALYVSTNGTGNAIKAIGKIQATSFVGDGSGLTNVPGFSLPFLKSATSSSTLFDITNDGVGEGGSFTINNAGSGASAIKATTYGQGSAVSVYASNSGNGSAALSSYHSGLGGAGSFSIGNSSNGSAATETQSDGSGTAITATMTGTGRAGLFKILNAANGSSAVDVVTTGSGSAGTFNISNVGSTADVLYVSTSGTGLAINANGKVQATQFIGDGSMLTNLPGGSLTLPSTNSVGNSGTLFSITNTGIGNAGAYTINNAGSSATVLSATNNGTGTALAVTSTNVSNSTSALSVYSAGSGVAGSFTVNNASATGSAVDAQSNGVLATIYSQNSGTGRAGIFKITNGSNSSPAFDVETVGTGRVGSFVVNNTGSSSEAVYAFTNGTGNSLTALNSGNSGSGAEVAISGSSNNSNALQVSTSGGGNAGNFAINNAGSSVPALYVTTNGSGNAITANGKIQATQYLGDGSLLTGISGFTLPYSGSSSSGSSLFAITNSGTAKTIDLVINNSGNASNGINVLHQGTGAAGLFQIQNPSSNATSVMGITNGGGYGGYFENTAASSFGPALYASIGGATNSQPSILGLTVGTGNASKFQVNNAGSAGNALYATTNGSGDAIVAENTGTGYAISTMGDISVSGSIDLVTGVGSPAISSTNSSGDAGFFSTGGTGAAVVMESTALAGSGDIATFKRSGGTVSSIDNQGRGYFDGGIQATTNASSTSLQMNTTGVGNMVLLQKSGITKFLMDNNGAIQANASGSTALQVNQASGANIAVFQNAGSNVARIDNTGKGYFNGGTVSSGADVAEAFEVEGAVSSYEPGDVMVISEENDRTLEKSSSANATTVVGVYATKPGVLLTEKGIDDNLGNTVPLGVIGVIPTKVCLENGPIKRGDLLVTSSSPGRAMKAIPLTINGQTFYPSGIVIGKALENFDGTGTGLIKVMVNVK